MKEMKIKHWLVMELLRGCAIEVKREDTKEQIVPTIRRMKLFVSSVERKGTLHQNVQARIRRAKERRMLMRLTV